MSNEPHLYEAAWQRLRESLPKLREGMERELDGLRGRLKVLTARMKGSCADNAAAEGFFGLLKRERSYYLTHEHIRDTPGDSQLFGTMGLVLLTPHLESEGAS